VATWLPMRSPYPLGSEVGPPGPPGHDVIARRSVPTPEEFLARERGLTPYPLSASRRQGRDGPNDIHISISLLTCERSHHRDGERHARRPAGWVAFALAALRPSHRGEELSNRWTIRRTASSPYGRAADRAPGSRTAVESDRRLLPRLSS
jgi:hypothetical protein